MERSAMATSMTPVRPPNKGGTITKGGVTHNYGPSPSGSGAPRHSPTMNAGGTMSANIGPGVKMTRTFAPSPVEQRAPASQRPNQGGSISAGIAPGVSMTRNFAPTPALQRGPGNAGGTIGGDIAPGVRMQRTYGPSPSIQPTRNPGMNAGGSIRTNLAPGVGMTRNFAPSPVLQRGAPSPAAQPMPAPVPPPQQTEQVNPLTGDGGSQGAIEGGPSEDVGDVPNLFSARGSAVPQGADSLPGSTTAGTGIYARKFTDPKKAQGYANYTRGLFA